MSDIYLDIDEYLWFTEYLQGNVNIAGLVFDDLIEESVDLGHETYVVWVDQVEETIGIFEDFNPFHLMEINDTIVLGELFGGAPIRVKQSVLNVVYTKSVMPIKIAHMHIDVVMSGSAKFMEEVSSELQIHSTYANAVPYYWESIFESIDIDMTEPQPLPPITLALKLLSTDIVNMRHDIVQDYYFNSKCMETFFIWDSYVWGWDKLVAESLVNTDTAREIIGKVADDYLLLKDEIVARLAVIHLINDTVFAFDEGTHERYYLCQANDIIEITDGEVGLVAVNTVGLISEILGFKEMASTQTVFIKLATESLVFSDISAFVHEIVIQEVLGLGDEELSKWMFNLLIASGLDISDNII